MVAGNHDYLKPDSYYRTFQWEKNVHMILTPEVSGVEFPEYAMAVYGLSYDAKEITEERFKGAYSRRSQPYEILIAHGGDEHHIPMTKEDMLGLGYDYIAMGHIHKPQIICPDKIAYAGALEPIDKNDTGAHGYIYGEITTKGCHTTFVPYAAREYVHMEIEVHSRMTGRELRECIRHKIENRGEEHIYKLILTGTRDPEVVFDPEQMDPFGNVIDIVDETSPAYNFAKLRDRNKENILGQFIECLKDSEPGSVTYQALCEGVQALMETRRG